MNLLIRLLTVLAAAFILGRLVSKFRLPAILGWLIAGMLLGPHALNVMNLELMDASWYKNIMYLFEFMIGIMIGSELIYRKLKQTGKQIIVTTLWQSLATFVIVSVCFGTIFYILDIPLYVALIFGSIALATAPAPALSIVQEYDAKGPVTDTLIPMAVLDDVLAIFIFITINAIIVSKYSVSSTSVMFSLFTSLLVPIIIGLPIGIIAGKLLNYSKSKKQNLIILLVFIVIGTLVGFLVNNVIIPGSNINFMLVGMAFAATFCNIVNLNKLQSIMESINPMIAFSLIMVIVNLGAPLDYNLIFNAGAFTFIYIVSRAVGKYSGAYMGAKISGMPDTVRKYLGLTLLPHSGVSLVFTGISVVSISQFDPSSAIIIQGTIAAAAVINEIFAVIIAKKGFSLANEIGE